MPASSPPPPGSAVAAHAAPPGHASPDGPASPPRRGALLALAAALPACASLFERSVPPPPGALDGGFAIERSLPKDLPQNAAPFSPSQFVLLASESALVTLSPVPFVGEVVKGVMDAQAAVRYEARFGDLDPHRLAVRAWAGSPRLAPADRPRTDATPLLRPFAYLQECADGRFRIALVHRIDAPGWTGRYMVHLRSSHPVEALAAPTPALLAAIGTELDEGTRLARTLVERDLDGAWARPIGTVDIGSFNLVGGRAAGLLSPELQHDRDGALLEEGPEHVVVRLKGMRGAAEANGGLLFGVHRLRKDQMHHYRRIAGGAAASQRTA